MGEPILGKIQLLADDVINKIAAGEVVERPASVVKELVENALDAGARSIQVEIEDGGRKAIAISDDGHGMDEDDALLALQRHATSKIRSVDDLYVTSSMGFRGEALASIASVSRLTLTTRERSAGSATRIEMNGTGAPVVQREVSAPTGTTLACRDLFYNVPARQKFLKSTASELGAITDFFDAAILCWPHIRLRLVHNSRELVASAAVTTGAEIGSVCGIGEASLRARAVAVFGEEVASKLIYINEADSHAAVEGLISPPGLEKANGKSMFTFVNQRWVKDKTLRYAIQRGYHSHLMRGKYPVVALHVVVDPSLVDVNVHPAKTEVRFQYGSEVQGVIFKAIMKGLRRADWAMPGMTAPRAMTSAPETTAFHQPDSARSAGGGTFPRGSKANASFRFGMTTTPTTIPATTPTQRRFFAPIEVTANPKMQESASIPWETMDYLGSVGRCYLMFTDGDRLLAVDQHAWHERIIFERLNRDRSLLHQSQAMIIPESVDLTPEQCSRLRAGAGILAANGFNLDFVGDDPMVEIKGIPTILAHRDPQEMLGAIADSGFAENPTADLAQNLLATYACHSAVRAGEDLGPDELHRLMREASEVDFQHNCPHGRRVFRWWETTQIASWFDR